MRCWACAGVLGANELGHAARPAAVPALRAAPTAGVGARSKPWGLPARCSPRAGTRSRGCQLAWSSAAAQSVWADRGLTRGRPDAVHTTDSWGLNLACRHPVWSLRHGPTEGGGILPDQCPHWVRQRVWPCALQSAIWPRGGSLAPHGGPRWPGPPRMARWMA